MNKKCHCWKTNREYALEKYGYLSPEHLDACDEDTETGVCMLEDGHDGPCEFTPDGEITISFS